MKRLLAVFGAMLALGLASSTFAAERPTKAPQLRTTDKPKKPDVPQGKSDKPPASQQDGSKDGEEDGSGGQVGRKVETKPEEGKPGPKD